MSWASLSGTNDTPASRCRASCTDTGGGEAVGAAAVAHPTRKAQSRDRATTFIVPEDAVRSGLLRHTRSDSAGDAACWVGVVLGLEAEVTSEATTGSSLSTA